MDGGYRAARDSLVEQQCEQTLTTKWSDYLCALQSSKSEFLDLKRGDKESLRIPGRWSPSRSFTWEQSEDETEKYRIKSACWMLEEDAAAFLDSLKTCVELKDLDKGIELHADACRRGLLGTNIFVGTLLVNMYAKCGALAKAQEVFDELPTRNIVSWNVLIAGYVHHGYSHEVLHAFDHMQHQGLCPNAVTFTCTLKACGCIGAAIKGEEIHVEVVKQGLLEKNIIIGNALVDMYAKCGMLEKAQQVFEELPYRSIVSWNVMIAGYAQQGQARKAFTCFEHMQDQGLSPDEVTFTCVLKASSSLGVAEKGNEIHAKIIKQGMLENNTIVSNALLNFYAKCGAFLKAQEVFDKLPVWNLVSWNVLIAGYVQHGYGHEALKCFEKMQQRGFHPNALTFSCILKACAIMGAIERGEEIHGEIAREGFLEINNVIGTALVDMYAKCGALEKAQEAFNELMIQDAVCWSALIAGLAQHGHDLEALACLKQMQQHAVSPDAVTLISILKACGRLGALEKGKEIHQRFVGEGLLKIEPVLGTALVDMYAKCGVITKTHEVFDQLIVQDVVSWSALIAGNAQLGRLVTALDAFNKMAGEGVLPNSVIFIVLLNACSHLGLVDEGQIYLVTMTMSGIIPSVDHHTCMVDLFGRAGLLEKAVAVMHEVFSSGLSDFLPLWSAFLGSCRKWENLKLGKWAFQQFLQLDKTNFATYACMSNIYVAANMPKEADKVDCLRVSNKIY